MIIDDERCLAESEVADERLVDWGIQLWEVEGLLEIEVGLEGDRVDEAIGLFRVELSDLFKHYLPVTGYLLLLD